MRLEDPTIAPVKIIDPTKNIITAEAPGLSSFVSPALHSQFVHRSGVFEISHSPPKPSSTSFAIR